MKIDLKKLNTLCDDHIQTILAQGIAHVQEG